MPEGLSIYQLLVLAGGLIGLYVKIQIDLNVMKQTFKSEVKRMEMRQETHEAQTDDIKKKLEEVLKAIEEIKLLLARKQLDN
jgi:L-serine deaminase